MNINLNLVFRVVFESRENYRLIDENKNIFAAEISGAFRYESKNFPAVGDWVRGSIQQGDWVLITEVLARKSILQRKDVSGSKSQILATNVDTLLIVTSANHDFNLNRLDRYVAMALSGGVKPVILINKMELVENPEHLVEQAATRFANAEVHGLSVYENWNLNQLDLYAQPDQTLAFVGSSGVGKSSLTNYLLGYEVMGTSLIRESDGRGRHTTTHRELHITPIGAVLIDTPGLRSVGLTDETDLSVLFGEIEELVQKCKFNDCQHKTEPKCAVQEALIEGQLSEDNWQNYLKLLKEVAFEKRKTNKALMLQQKKKWAKALS